MTNKIKALLAAIIVTIMTVLGCAQFAPSANAKASVPYMATLSHHNPDNGYNDSIGIKCNGGVIYYLAVGQYSENVGCKAYAGLGLTEIKVNAGRNISCFDTYGNVNLVLTGTGWHAVNPSAKLFDCVTSGE